MRVSVKQKYFILFLTGRNLAIYVIPDNQTITEEIEISITITTRYWRIVIKTERFVC